MILTNARVSGVRREAAAEYTSAGHGAEAIERRARSQSGGGSAQRGECGCREALP